MTKREWIPRLFAILAVIGVLAVYRLLPHPWNFTPVVATAIFGGMYLSRSLGMILPIGAMLISDLFLSFDWVVTPVIYGSILIAALLGRLVMPQDFDLPFARAQVRLRPRLFFSY
jgi:hypothetical protein